jgi:hypothetical protein
MRPSLAQGSFPKFHTIRPRIVISAQNNLKVPGTQNVCRRQRADSTRLALPGRFIAHFRQQPIEFDHSGD